MVDRMTFKAALRLPQRGVDKDKGKPRTCIIVFDNQYHLNEMWRLVRKLGATNYNFRTHLPLELAQFRSELLQYRSKLWLDKKITARVCENKGYPYLEEKRGDGTWITTKEYTINI